MRELLEKLTPALLLDFKSKIDDQYGRVFLEALCQHFATAAAQEAFGRYLVTYAKVVDDEPAYINDQPNEALVRLFILNLLNRLAAQEKLSPFIIIEDDIKKDVAAAINSELAWTDTWAEETVTHKKPAMRFSLWNYFVNSVVLGYSTYVLDDTVTLGGRFAKAVSYSGGIAPTEDLSKVSGYQHEFFVANMNLMYAYVGITALSFLLVPARACYKWYKDGWAAFKAEFTNRDNLFELGVNTVIVTFTACAIFAPVISWPFVTVMFSFGLIAAFYTSYYTDKAAAENTALLQANTDKMHVAQEELSALREKLRGELAKEVCDPAVIDRLSAEAASKKITLQNILGERQPLLVKDANNASFFGKYGTKLKIGIAATTLVAHVIIATVFTASLTAAFWPALIVMVALAVAALAYTGYRQYRAYQLQQELHKERVLQVAVTNDHVKIAKALNGRPVVQQQVEKSAGRVSANDSSHGALFSSGKGVIRLRVEDRPETGKGYACSLM